MALHRRLGNRHGETAILDSLGVAHHRLGRPDLAIDSFHRGLVVVGATGDLHVESTVLGHLAEAHEAAGHALDASDAGRRARSLLERMDQDRPVSRVR